MILVLVYERQYVTNSFNRYFSHVRTSYRFKTVYDDPCDSKLQFGKKFDYNHYKGSREESEVADFFVFSQ